MFRPDWSRSVRAERAKLKDLVMKAGFHRPDALSIFMTVKLVVTLASGTLLGFQMAAGQWLGEYTSTPTILLAGLAGAVLGGILPEMCFGLVQRSSATPDGHGATGRAGLDDTLP